MIESFFLFACGYEEVVQNIEEKTKVMGSLITWKNGETKVGVL